MSHYKRVSALAAVVMASVVVSVGVSPTASSDPADGDTPRSGSAGKTVEVTNYKLSRYEIDTQQDFDTFVAAFEQAVPAFTPALFAGVTNWNDVVANTEVAAPNGFLIYAKLTFDAFRISGVGSDNLRGASYLMGNHVVAEMMYRHNPGVMLNAPLRVMIFENEQGDAMFEIERPSDQFGAYGDREVAKVGRLLSQKVSGLMRALGVTVPTGLAR